MREGISFYVLLFGSVLTKDLLNVRGCPKCDGEMLLLPSRYILQESEVANEKFRAKENGQHLALRVYVCGKCCYAEFYLPFPSGYRIIEAPPEIS